MLLLNAAEGLKSLDRNAARKILDAKAKAASGAGGCMLSSATIPSLRLLSCCCDMVVSCLGSGQGCSYFRDFLLPRLALKSLREKQKSITRLVSEGDQTL